MRTIQMAAAALAAGETSARALVETCLERIADPGGQGARAFVRVHAESARAMATAIDALRRAGRAPSPFAGIPVSLKDLFDIGGEPTPAGSRVLADAAPATGHAPVVARLLAAGLIPIGRTNMAEFAYSGLGPNPHFGTPLSPWDRAGQRVPGGSSSGAAVSVADGMAVGAIGTDTGGSCRIPAAFCGVTGYKPTARRIPREGAVPLSTTLDSIGPLANSVACCAILDAVMAGEAPAPPVAPPLAGLRLGLPETVACEALDADVARAFERALGRLEAAGVRIVRRRFTAFDLIGEVTALGGFSAAESFAWHRELLARAGAGYDPRVRGRIERGREQSAADYLGLVAARARMIARMDAETADLDAVAMPTVHIVPPRLDELADDEAYYRINMQSLRNTSIANLLDRCAISLPCQAPDEPPVGFMLVGETMGDSRLFRLAAAIEAAVRI